MKTKKRKHELYSHERVFYLNILKGRGGKWSIPFGRYTQYSGSKYRNKAVAMRRTMQNELSIMASIWTPDRFKTVKIELPKRI